MPQTKGRRNEQTMKYFFEGEQDVHETDPGGLNEMRNL